jgi:hypothetical protein
MRRRKFITALGLTATWPFAARAQQPSMPVIGFLGSESSTLWANLVRAFHQGLGETGYVEGRGDRIPLGRGSKRPSAGTHGRLDAPSSERDSRPRQHACSNGRERRDYKDSNSLRHRRRPRSGGPRRQPQPTWRQLLTGVVTLNVEIAPKRLELLREQFPTATSFALLVNPTYPALAEPVMRGVQAEARTLGIELHLLHASSDSDLDPALATAARLRVAGLVVALR